MVFGFNLSSEIFGIGTKFFYLFYTNLKIKLFDFHLYKKYK